MQISFSKMEALSMQFMERSLSISYAVQCTLRFAVFLRWIKCFANKSKTLLIDRWIAIDFTFWMNLWILN